jgi:competence protein ComEC
MQGHEQQAPAQRPGPAGHAPVGAGQSAGTQLLGRAPGKSTGTGTAMGRLWLPGVALAWLLGLGLQLQQAALWRLADGLGLVGAACILAAVAWPWRQRLAGLLILLLAAAAIGFCTTHTRAVWRLADTLPSALEGQDIVLTGVVAELPRQSITGTRFVFNTESASLRGVPVSVPARVALGWWRSADEEVVVGGPTEDLRAGQRWRLPVRLRQPHGSLNPHGFDLELWLFEQGIRASGSVRSRPELPAVKLTDNAGHPIERLRQSLRDRI